MQTLLRVALMDATTCQLSDEVLAGLLGVEATTVAARRAWYDVPRGEQLSDHHRRATDGLSAPSDDEVRAVARARVRLIHGGKPRRPRRRSQYVAGTPSGDTVPIRAGDDLVSQACLLFGPPDRVHEACRAVVERLGDVLHVLPAWHEQRAVRA